MKTQTPPVILVLFRLLVVVIALVCLFRLGSWLLGPNRLARPIVSKEWLAGLPALLTVCTLDTLILCFLIWRSRLSGWRLVLATGFIFYSVKTFIPQLDLIYFYRSMPTITKAMLAGILLMSLPMAVFFPPIAFVETATSNFIFGFAASALLQWTPKPHALKPVLNPAAQEGLEPS